MKKTAVLSILMVMLSGALVRAQDAAQKYTAGRAGRQPLPQERRHP